MKNLIPYNQQHATFEVLNKNLLKNYEFKEKVILDKHDVEIEIFASALQ